jgi:hypothetical protein
MRAGNHQSGIIYIRGSSMKIVIKFLVSILVLFTFEAAESQERRISRKQLPAAVEQTVARESEGAHIEGFATEIEHRQKLYELSLTVNGRSKDVLIQKDGTVVEIEEEVSFSDLPADVQKGLKEAAGVRTIETVESLTKKGQLVAYEAQLRLKKRRSEIQVGPHGEKLAHKQ